MRRWRVALAVFFLGLAAYVAVAGGEHSLMDARRAEAELDRRRAELLVLRAQNDSLALRIDSLLEDDWALERLARERYGFIRDGEYLYRVSSGGEEAAEGGR